MNLPTTNVSRPEPTSAIGFKEWAYVCEALADGVQSIILRKGGIHEGRGGFEWKHREFFLFPTFFHSQAEQLRWTPPAAAAPLPPEDQRQSVDIRAFATFEEVWKVTDWSRMEKLAPLHIWAEPVVRERFAYDEESCLHVALVRVFWLPDVWSFPYLPGYGGCRSWVNLPPDGLPMLADSVPAVSETEWQRLAVSVREILGD